MVKYYHLESGGGRLSEITEGEYEFRMRKTPIATEPLVMQEFMQPGHGFESRFGTCFCVEVANAPQA